MSVLDKFCNLFGFSCGPVYYILIYPSTWLETLLPHDTFQLKYETSCTHSTQVYCSRGIKDFSFQIKVSMTLYLYNFHVDLLYYSSSSVQYISQNEIKINLQTLRFHWIKFWEADNNENICFFSLLKLICWFFGIYFNQPWMRQIVPFVQYVRQTNHLTKMLI
jgi:hypothetical protein